MENNVSLTISKEIVNPIIQAKVQEAIIAALGGADKVIEKVVTTIINQKVDTNGRPCTYSDAKTWLEVVVNQQIEAAVKGEVQKAVQDATGSIREVLVKTLQTKKGANLVADALLSSLNGTFANSYRSTFSIGFTKEN